MYLTTTEGFIVAAFVVSMAIAIFALCFGYWRLDNKYVRLHRRYHGLEENYIAKERLLRQYDDYIKATPDGYPGYFQYCIDAKKQSEITLYPETQDDGEVIYLPDASIPTLDDPETQQIREAVNGAKVT